MCHRAGGELIPSTKVLCDLGFDFVEMVESLLGNMDTPDQQRIISKNKTFVHLIGLIELINKYNDELIKVLDIMGFIGNKVNDKLYQQLIERKLQFQRKDPEIKPFQVTLEDVIDEFGNKNIQG